mmetsp:Transcript_31428/g.46642  ORF Transcript_31428/g.46642 Transcript_31428/m.46642 type:complete len:173 (-) Transcript_31428:147-665(-)|eukprot:CAMPEP_0194048528 /NCGR_PEP_ID=MMETSP0009_2-20130614/27587_1 /TAXON_ID=210454 /ORGANISM="Grammatophora oceanica, Strain CCMP 410" /LENGTH=172 /DNA_ID=CAMNT_0038694425 /DNA_START=259 /DNA_END=777 /DNA_ORIENTATION=+
MIDPNICAGFSVVGAIFLFWVWLLLETQPFFVPKIDDYDTAKSSAIYASIAYGATFGISMLFVARDARKRRLSELMARSTYQQVGRTSHHSGSGGGMDGMDDNDHNRESYEFTLGDLPASVTDHLSSGNGNISRSIHSEVELASADNNNGHSSSTRQQQQPVQHQMPPDLLS